jgi:IS30 family transposase
VTAQVRSSGNAQRLETETLYQQLVQSGVDTVEACRIARIGRKTGYRWRAENGGLPPTRVAESACSKRTAC